jgi:hypothetical protein
MSVASPLGTILRSMPRGCLCRSKIRFGGARCGDAVRSGGVVVFVDQAAQDGLPLDPVGLEVGDGGRGRGTVKFDLTSVDQAEILLENSIDGAIDVRFTLFGSWAQG